MKFFPSLFSSQAAHAQIVTDDGPQFEIVKESAGHFTTDGWADVPRNLGTPRKGRGYLGTYRLSYDELSHLTDFDWLSRRVVRALPEAAWQDELVFAKDTDRDNWQAINAVQGNDDGAFLTAAIWARTHGAALLIVGHEFSGDVEQPLPASAGPVAFLSPVSVTDYAVHAEDVNKDRDDPKNYGFPEYYRITGDHRFAGLRIHRTRVILFVGPTISDVQNSREPEKLVQLSALDPVYEAIMGYGITWQSVQNMTEQASIPVWTLKGLIRGLTQGAKETRDRMALQNEMISTANAVVLDADSGESYKREAASLSDIPQILQQVSIRVAAASGIPAQELFGRLISGLGDTGEGESKKWQATISSYRTRSLAPRIRQILGPDVEWDFAPVVTPEPKTWAETVQIWWNMGQITDAELRKITEEALTLPELTDAERAELEALNSAASSQGEPDTLPDDEEGDDEQPDDEEGGEDGSAQAAE